jgi:IS5 family transposase
MDLTLQRTMRGEDKKQSSMLMLMSPDTRVPQTHHPGYAISQRIRKRVEEVFGWVKTVGAFRKTRYVGFGANQVAAYMLAAAYNLVRMPKLTAAT